MSAVGVGRGRVKRPTRRALPWAVLVVVVAVSLVVGASGRSGRETNAQRSAAIDAHIKCPSCDGLSVADSSAAIAVAIRQDVAQRVRNGQSDADIEEYLVSRYGQGILLRPPTRGATSLVWVVPGIAVIGGLIGLGVFFWRRRRVESLDVAEADRLVVARALAESRAGGP
jgi:cytochrome c-type biogenesis protein CcmH